MGVTFNRPEVIGNLVMITGKYVPEVSSNNFVGSASLDFSPYFRELVDVKYVIEQGKDIVCVKVGTGISSASYHQVALTTTADKVGSTGTGMQIKVNISSTAVNLSKAMIILNQGEGYEFGEIITAECGVGANNPKFMVVPKSLRANGNNTSDTPILLRGSEGKQEAINMENPDSRSRTTMNIAEGANKTYYGFGDQPDDTVVQDRIVKFVAFGKR